MRGDLIAGHEGFIRPGSRLTLTLGPPGSIVATAVDHGAPETAMFLEILRSPVLYEDPFDPPPGGQGTAEATSLFPGAYLIRGVDRDRHVSKIVHLHVGEHLEERVEVARFGRINGRLVDAATGAPIAGEMLIVEGDVLERPCIAFGTATADGTLDLPPLCGGQTNLGTRDAMLATFVVEPGEVVDLGTIAIDRHPQ
jgi:hypothetical protein